MWSIRLIFCDCGFQSVCPLMDKDKRLMEASWWGSLTEGETGSCSVSFRAQENKICHSFYFCPVCFPWSNGTGCHDLHFFSCWILSQPLHYPLSPLSRGSLVPVHFLPLEWITCISEVVAIFPSSLDSCDSGTSALCMMYSAQKLNKHCDNIQPWHTPFAILNQSIVPCLVLTVASWPAYRFLRRQYY